MVFSRASVVPVVLDVFDLFSPSSESEACFFSGALAMCIGASGMR